MASLFTAGLMADSTSSTSCLLHGRECYIRIILRKRRGQRLGRYGKRGSREVVEKREWLQNRKKIKNLCNEHIGEDNLMALLVTRKT